jgi:hypothetical protein
MNDDVKYKWEPERLGSRQFNTTRSIGNTSLKKRKEEKDGVRTNSITVNSIYLSPFLQ